MKLSTVACMLCGFVCVGLSVVVVVVVVVVIIVCCCCCFGWGWDGGGSVISFFLYTEVTIKVIFFFFLSVSPFFPSPDSYTIHFCFLTSGVELSIWRASTSSAYVAKFKKQKQTFHKEKEKKTKWTVNVEMRQQFCDVLFPVRLASSEPDIGWRGKKGISSTHSLQQRDDEDVTDNHHHHH